MTHRLHFTTRPPNNCVLPFWVFQLQQSSGSADSLLGGENKINQCGVRYTGSLPPVISLSKTPQLSHRLSIKNVCSPKPGGCFRPDKAPGRDARICPKCSGIPRDESTGRLWKNSPVPFKKIYIAAVFDFSGLQQIPCRWKEANKGTHEHNIPLGVSKFVVCLKPWTPPCWDFFSCKSQCYYV